MVIKPGTLVRVKNSLYLYPCYVEYVTKHAPSLRNMFSGVFDSAYEIFRVVYAGWHPRIPEHIAIVKSLSRDRVYVVETKGLSPFDSVICDCPKENLKEALC